MTDVKSTKLKLVHNSISDISNTEENLTHNSPTGNNENYQTNPIYEKLLKYKELQKKKRFTVEDLLKW